MWTKTELRLEILNFHIDAKGKIGVKSCVCLTLFQPFWAVRDYL